MAIDYFIIIYKTIYCIISNNKIVLKVITYNILTNYFRLKTYTKNEQVGN